MTMRLLFLLFVVGCTPMFLEVERPEPCVTYVLTEFGDTVAFRGLDVPPENLNGVAKWWTEGCDPPALP